jgi:hypothetical protein
MRRLGAISIVLGTLLWGSASAATIEIGHTASKGSIARATALLNGKRFTHFVETGSIGVPSSYDERLHLCTGGRFVFDEVSNLPEVGTRVARTTGRWRVLSASFTRGRAVARVRGVASNRALVVTIVTDGRRTKIGGRAVSRIPRRLERALLGPLMSVAAFVAERRLIKQLRRRR